MLGVCICDTWLWWVLSRSGLSPALPNSKTETLKSQNLKKTRHRRDMERRLKWKGTNDGGIQLHRADVLLSFFSRTGPLFFSNTSSSVLLFLSPPLLKLPSTFPSLRPLLCLSLPPLWCFVSYFSYLEFHIISILHPICPPIHPVFSSKHFTFWQRQASLLQRTKCADYLSLYLSFWICWW